MNNYELLIGVEWGRKTMVSAASATWLEVDYEDQYSVWNFFWKF